MSSETLARTITPVPGISGPAVGRVTSEAAR